MSMTTYYLLTVYFALNFFIAGQFYQAEKLGLRNKKHVIAFWLAFIIAILFGTCLIVVELLNRIVTHTNNYLHISFWYKWFFTRQHYQMETDTLYRMNCTIRTQKQGWRKYELYIMGLVNKRSNYTFKPEEQSSPNTEVTATCSGCGCGIYTDLNAWFCPDCTPKQNNTGIFEDHSN